MREVLENYRKTRDWINRNEGKVPDLQVIEARRDMNRYARLFCDMTLEDTGGVEK